MIITRDDLNEIKEKIRREWNYKTGEYKGFIYEIIRYHTYWYLCGYVLLPKTHKYYWKDYLGIDVRVHWGLTYWKQKGVYWKIGFDCAHYDDLVPDRIERLMRNKNRLEYNDWFYKTMDYVVEEIKKLIDQL